MVAMGLQRITLAVLLLLPALVSCTNVSRDETSRVSSPDSLVDAVLIRINAGATTPYAYEMYLVPVGGKPEQGHEVFRADNLVDLEIHWKHPKILEIQYREARIFHFSNFWQSRDVENFRYVVQLQLAPQ